MSNEKNKKYEWDLEAILENKTLETLYNNWEKSSNELITIYDDIFKSYENFKNWILKNEKNSILTNRISNYISNKLNENLADQTWISWTQKLDYVSTKINIKLSDYNNRLYKNEKAVRSYLENKELSEYKRAFDNLLKFKSHTLTDKEEKLLSELSITNGGIESIFSSLTDSEIKFDDAYDSKNKKHKIQKMSDAIVMLKSKDRTLRKNTWISFNKAFYDFRNSLTYSLYYNYLELNKHAQIRNFKNYIDATCFSDEINQSLLTTIYECVSEYKHSYDEYLSYRNSLLKKILNIKKVEPWDASVDLSTTKITFEIEEAKKIVLDALKPMGDEYLSIVKKAFSENWISWLPKKNKYSGAYSIGGTKGLSKFYILMNYDKTLNSVFTIIHELGHSINSYYYSKKQKVYASTTIFCAEIASITNEMLLNYYLMNKYKDNKKFLLMILDELISGFYATTTRQIIFSNFEWIINGLINDEKPINYDVISSTYLNVMNKYMKIKNIEKYQKEPYKYSLVTPLRISHFYAGNFYVYKYAIGQVVAILIAKKIINNEDGFINKYIEFLSSGTSKSPIDTIKILGIDLYDKNTWIKANEEISELIKIYKKLKINNI